MNNEFSDQANAALDGIIMARRTNRAFAKEPQPRAAIEQIIHAGLWAPYAAVAVGAAHAPVEGAGEGEEGDGADVGRMILQCGSMQH